MAGHGRRTRDAGPTQRRATGDAARPCATLTLTLSAQVYIDERGQLEKLADAVRRGRMLKCKICGTKGATLGCHVRSCRSSFHLHCARASGAVLDARSGRVICSTHAAQLEPGKQAGGGHKAGGADDGGAGARQARTPAPDPGAAAPGAARAGAVSCRAAAPLGGLHTVCSPRRPLYVMPEAPGNRVRS